MMLNVKKGPEPRALAVLRATPGSDWSSVHADQKAEIRSAALQDQGGLCAYCTRTLPAAGPTTIEHWNARSSGADPFRWRDLLVVCSGDLSGIRHCDRSRGNRRLTLHPADPAVDVEVLTNVRSDGYMESNAAPADIVTLYLNHPTLLRSRREVIDAVLSRLKGAKLVQLKAEERRWTSPTGGKRHEYSHAALCLIRRVIRHRESNPSG